MNTLQEGLHRSHHKILIAGPVGAGKTTAVATLSDIPPVRTDELATDMTALQKSTTTVALDYGRIDLDGGEHVHIYGAPGQERFDFMWDILSQGSIGLLLLVNNHRPAPLQDLSFFVDSFSQRFQKTQFAVGVTHMDESRAPDLDAYHQILEKRGCQVPVFEVDARDRDDMKSLLRALLYSLDPGLVDHG